MICGIDTTRSFVGRCRTLSIMMDRMVEKEYGINGDIYLMTLMRIELQRGIAGQDINREYLNQVETLYYALDDPILKYAIDQDHLWTFTINHNGFYLANCLA